MHAGRRLCLSSWTDRRTSPLPQRVNPVKEDRAAIERTIGCKGPVKFYVTGAPRYTAMGLASWPDVCAPSRPCTLLALLVTLAVLTHSLLA